MKVREGHRAWVRRGRHRVPGHRSLLRRQGCHQDHRPAEAAKEGDDTHGAQGEKVMREMYWKCPCVIVSPFRGSCPVSVTRFENSGNFREDRNCGNVSNSVFSGDEGAPPPQPGELHRVLHGRGPPLGGDGVSCWRTAHRRRHGNHHEGGADRGSVQRGGLLMSS